MSGFQQMPSPPSAAMPQGHAGNMLQATSIDTTPKGSRRKGARSVSTLTASQLARKRANDREAQRAIRARTREHIERLEQEVEDLKGAHGKDRTVQDLLRKNRALEDEINQLKDTIGLSIQSSSPYSSSVYDDDVSRGSGIPSPRTSPFPPGDYSTLPPEVTMAPSYVSLQATNDATAWPSSTVSSPCSSSAHTEPDYITTGAVNLNIPAMAPPSGYIPTSVPSAMHHQHHQSSHMPLGTSNLHHGHGIKLEYDELGNQYAPNNIQASPPHIPALSQYGQHNRGGSAGISHQSGFRQPHQHEYIASHQQASQRQQAPIHPSQQQQEGSWDGFPLYYSQHV